ncbi:integrase core domain-containing protein [Bradyrhizobium nanningense]|uniref:integrase core domain-containing protein n=1 Tax=Bradyrhizobium nanningense TaxID=1325118 RepID=UPI003D31F004
MAEPVEVAQRIDKWMDDYNSGHPHSPMGYRSPREYIAQLDRPSVRSNGDSSSE